MSRVIGKFTCPSDDGNYETTVIDLSGWFTGACLIEQVGQGQKHELVLTKAEAAKLAAILADFANSK